MIHYDVVTNSLTTPVSYTARARASRSVTKDELYAEIARRGGVDAARVASIYAIGTQVLLDFLLQGASVEIDDLCDASVSIKARLADPTSPLPADHELLINLNADRRLVDALRNAAHLHRGEAPSQDPVPLKVSVLGGEVTRLSSGQLLTIEGDRLNHTPSRTDEGVFLIAQSNGATLRATVYNARGPKRVAVLVPDGLLPDEDYALQVRARSLGGNATGPLYTGTYKGALHSV